MTTVCGVPHCLADTAGDDAVVCRRDIEELGWTRKAVAAVLVATGGALVVASGAHSGRLLDCHERRALPLEAGAVKLVQSEAWEAGSALAQAVLETRLSADNLLGKCCSCRCTNRSSR